MNKRIEVCGNIGSGKTTLAQLISNKLGYSSVLENFNNNPFLSIFYSNPPAYAMETEITFLLQHYNAIKVELLENTSFVCDNSLLQDKSFADVTLSDVQRKVFMSVFDYIKTEIRVPDIQIYVKCPVDVVMKRIRARNRDVEKGISEDYLSLLQSAIEKNVDSIGCETKLIVIDSDRFDYATDCEHKDQVIEKIKHEISVL